VAFSGFLTDHAKPCQIVTTTAGAAGTSAITSSAVDMAGYLGCLFIVTIGAIVTGGVQSIKLQQSSDDAAADDYSDIADTSQTVADDADNTTFLIDIRNPQKRYLKLVVSRATQNATVGGVIAIPYGKKSRGAVLSAGTAITAIERFNFPAEGTA
jgi:hypothetical protein